MKVYYFTKLSSGREVWFDNRESAINTLGKMARLFKRLAKNAEMERVYNWHCEITANAIKSGDLVIAKRDIA